MATDGQDEKNVAALAQVERVRASYAAGLTKPLAWRREQLHAAKRFLVHEHDAIVDALRVDLAKPDTEAYLSDIATVAGEIDYFLRHLARLARPRHARLPLALHPGRGRISPEPLGVVVVISPWNYPVNLTLAPMMAAIAAGNTVVAKPSELAPATSTLIAERLTRYLDPRAVAVVEGDGAVVDALVSAGVDHVLFTGSARVGRIVMAAAARGPVPVTLELGGLNPVIVGRRADVFRAARRIMWGKFFNVGQSCVAPDFVLVERAVAEQFLAACVEAIGRFFGPDPRLSPDYGRIVTGAHLERLSTLLSGHGGSVVVGGDSDAKDRYLAPTLLYDVDGDSAVMGEEIFGPILPVNPVDSIDEAVGYLAGRPTPLTLALFVGDRRLENGIIGRTRSGSVTVNTVLEHFAAPGLPFGGLGASGFGAYHGEAGYATFTHRRAILRRPNRPEIPFAYPPMTARKRALLRRIL